MGIDRQQRGEGYGHRQATERGGEGYGHRQGEHERAMGIDREGYGLMGNRESRGGLRAVRHGGLCGGQDVSPFPGEQQDLVLEGVDLLGLQLNQLHQSLPLPHVGPTHRHVLVSLPTKNEEVSLTFTSLSF